jgi:hypothetical protein
MGLLEPLRRFAEVHGEQGLEAESLGIPVADRTDELVAKKNLTREKQGGLARLLNKPILDAITNPPLEFVSRHRFTRTDVTGRILAIDWFANCGKPAEFDLTMNFERVKSWPKAMQECKSRAWGYAKLEARNQLTVALHHLDKEKYRSWNTLTDEFKNEIVLPSTEKIWKPFQERHGLKIDFVHTVQWSILAAMMENAYMPCKHGSFFFLELLAVYEAGHFPCGWRGHWPNGELVVF